MLPAPAAPPQRGGRELRLQPPRAKPSSEGRLTPETQAHAGSEHFQGPVGCVGNERGFMSLPSLRLAHPVHISDLGRPSNGAESGVCNAQSASGMFSFQVYLNRHQMENLSVPDWRSFPTDLPRIGVAKGRKIAFLYHVLQKNGDKDPLV